MGFAAEVLAVCNNGVVLGQDLVKTGFGQSILGVQGIVGLRSGEKRQTQQMLWTKRGFINVFGCDGDDTIYGMEDTL